MFFVCTLALAYLRTIAAGRGGGSVLDRPPLRAPRRRRPAPAAQIPSGTAPATPARQRRLGAGPPASGAGADPDASDRVSAFRLQPQWKRLLSG